MINPIPITTRDNFSAVMSDDVKYLATNSGPQITKFCNGIIAPLMKNNMPNAPKTFFGKKEDFSVISYHSLLSLHFFLIIRGICSNVCASVMSSPSNLKFVLSVNANPPMKTGSFLYTS